MASGGPPPIVYILLLAGLGGGGYYAYRQGWIPGLGSQAQAPVVDSLQQPPAPIAVAPAPGINNPGAPAAPPTALIPADIEFTAPNPAVLQLDGSVTMVKFVQGVRALYNQQFPNLPATYGIPDGKPRGSNRGLQGLLDGSVHIAATSRPLNTQEIQAGIRAIPVARDALAVVVGINNPFKGGLTMAELAGIFQGRITNWSQVGGPNVPIKVINRSRDSGTHDLFKSLVLLGQDFAPDSSNFTTFPQDVTTPILRALGTDGISYTTVAQAANQQTIRIVPIDGISPTDVAAVRAGRYPISRQVFLAVPRRTSPAAKAFIDLALSPQGQEIAGRSDFLPL
ncbi:MAG: PstS family phosphate ABC transporter substrate-binding protein [Thermostichales cyanobacterium BF4_bins_65]